MKRKICVVYQQEGIDPPSCEKPANYGQTLSLAVKGRKSVWVCETHGETQKNPLPTKRRMDFEYKMICIIQKAFDLLTNEIGFKNDNWMSSRMTIFHTLHKHG